MALQTIVVLDETNKIPIAELPDDIVVSSEANGDKKVVSITYDPTIKKIKVIYRST